MELRNYYRVNKNSTALLKVEPLNISNFKILGQQITVVTNSQLTKC
jgi:hypothetical protein